jgi:hypothetical protein
VLVVLALGAQPAFAEALNDKIVKEAPEGSWRLENSDRLYLISTQADTMAPMSFRVGTVNQLQTVQGQGGGYALNAYADFAPTSWLQLGATINYGTIGDPAIQNVVSPTLYGKVQFLRQESAGINMATAVNFKKIGFGHLTDAHPNSGEIEAQILVDKRIGNLTLTANGIFGKSLNVPDSDAELKLSGGYYVLPNLVLGLDTITRYDTSFDGGPKDGTRYWEFTGGGFVTTKLAAFTLSLLAGVAAPMHFTAAPSQNSPGVGPTGMFQIGYAL